MILKGIDDKTFQLTSLEALLTTSPASMRAGIQRDIAAIRAGIRAEQEAAYYIDFDLKDSERTAVIHDLRLEVDGRVAQIDHVVIHKTLTVFALETKHIASGLKITEDGEFLRWNDYRKSYEGMASPLAQNGRHLAVLKDAFRQIDLPTRLGMRLEPSYRSLIVVSPQARIDRPKKFDTSCVIKSDGLIEAMEKSFDRAGVLSTFGAAARLVSSDTVADIGRQLVGLHRPSCIDYAQKYRGHAAVDPATAVCEPAVEEQTQPARADRFACRQCGKAVLTIQHGRYGYYFKCSSCAGNTPIKIDCGKEGHKERLRKQGLKFFRECAECGSSSLFFVNTS